MLKFRKKSVEIEAFQNIDNHTAPRPHWAMSDTRIHYFTDGHMEIDTLEGRMRAESGDWIIRGVKGEVYPCKPDIFAATYDSV